MGRRSSSKSAGPSRGFASRAQPAPARPASTPAAAAAPQPPAPAQGGGFLGNLGSNIMSGMASGVGFSMANRAVDAVMGPRQVEMVHTTAEAPAAPAQPIMNMNNPPTTASNVCQLQREQLNQCLSQAGDMAHCNYYFESLKQCQQQSPA